MSVDAIAFERNNTGIVQEVVVDCNPEIVNTTLTYMLFLFTQDSFTQGTLHSGGWLCINASIYWEVSHTFGTCTS